LDEQGHTASTPEGGMLLEPLCDVTWTYDLIRSVEPSPRGDGRLFGQGTAAFTGRLEAAGVAVSMDGRGRCLDNVFVERLWRSVTYEWLYTHCYEGVPDLERGLAEYFRFYNHERLHQSLDYRTPAEVYREHSNGCRSVCS